MRCSIALVSAAALLAGCGGGGTKHGGGTVTAQAGQTVRVVADEYSFNPATVVLGAGPLRVELKNDGVLAHNLRVIRNGQDVGGTDTFQGGTTKSATVQLQPGSYEFVCSVGNHAQLGMRGQLQVGPAPPGRSPGGPAEQ